MKKEMKCECGFLTIFEMTDLPYRHKCWKCKKIMIVKDKKIKGKKK